MKYKIILLFIILITASSCATRKKMLLFQDAVQIDTLKKDFDKTSPGLVYIRPYDVLQIDIKTMDIQLNNMFQDQAKSGVSTGVATGALGGFYYWGYLIDHEGFVDLPLLGRVQLGGLTIRQARDLIANLLKDYVVEPYVDMKFLTFKIYLFGEVNRPGLITVPNESSNIIEVLSLAGDLTNYANRKRVKILRGDPRNPEVFIIDLTHIQSFYTNGFFLEPNDIVYVEPMNRKWLALTAGDFSALLTFLSVIIVITNVLGVFSNE